MKKVLIVAALATMLGGCDLAPKTTNTAKSDGGVSEKTFITCRWPNGEPMEIPGSGGLKIENMVPVEWDVSDYRYYKIRPGAEYKLIRAPVQNCVVSTKG